ncbi:hypothetical protein G4B88_015008, partial [Cannabis sativa]
MEEWSFIEGGVFPRLKNLNFQQCKRLKLWGITLKNVLSKENETVDEASSSRRYTTYDTLYWSFIEGGVFPRLKNLSLDACERLKFDIMIYIIDVKSLETLEFYSLPEFEEWSFIEGGVFPRLKNLHFEECERLKVTLLGDYFPSLTNLSIYSSEAVLYCVYNTTLLGSVSLKRLLGKLQNLTNFSNQTCLRAFWEQLLEICHVGWDL